MTSHYVHIELTQTGVVKVETKGVTLGQALELIVEGLEAIRGEAHLLGGAQTAASELLLPRGVG